MNAELSANPALNAALNVGAPLVGTFTDISGEKEANILLSGIPLYQLIYPFRLYSEHRIHGVFNVIVTSRSGDDVGARRRVTRRGFTRQWLCGGNCYITFEKPRRNMPGIAWMPDDPWWHNRLCLMDDANLLNMVSELRLPNNEVKRKFEINLEIECLKQELKTERKIWNVTNRGRVVASLNSKPDALQWMKEAKMPIQQHTPQGSVVVVKRRQIVYTLEEGLQIEYKPEIQDLIKKYKMRFEHGWTECQEFQEGIRPRVIERIKSERTKISDTGKKPTISATDLAMAIDLMPDEEKQKFYARIATAAADKVETVT